MGSLRVYANFSSEVSIVFSVDFVGPAAVVAETCGSFDDVKVTGSRKGLAYNQSINQISQIGLDKIK